MPLENYYKLPLLNSYQVLHEHITSFVDYEDTYKNSYHMCTVHEYHKLHPSSTAFKLYVTLRFTNPYKNR